MKYTRLFDWKKLEQRRGARPDGGVRYLYSDSLELAVNVALATSRPLLLSGEPGSGKSTLAADVAWKLSRRFYSDTVTSRTQAQDLQWSFDAVERLSLATAGKPVNDSKRFVRPGVLFQAFNAKLAGEHGEAQAPRIWGDTGKHAVVLLDEIDKADPDVPNDLLAVMDRREFRVRETGVDVKAPDGLEVLVVLTTNGERDLPPAFLRRCVTFEITLPKEAPARREHMTRIARRHFSETEVSDALLGAVLDLFSRLREHADKGKLREPSTAELIDAVAACRKLGINSPRSGSFREIATAAMWKHPTKPAPLEDPTPSGAGS